MLSALAFLTILGPSRAPDGRTMRWFPLIGALVGAAVAATHWGAHQVWSPLVAASIVVGVDLVLTGALHLDGLADTADGVLPHMDRQRRLAVMAEPDVGAFALAVVVPVLLTRWAVLADPTIEPVALIAIWAMSRTVVAVIPAVVPYARPEGLASPFLEGSSVALGIFLLPVAAMLVAVRGPLGGAVVVVSLLAAAGLVDVARRRLGGFTGDVLGAVLLVCETVALLILVAQP